MATLNTRSRKIRHSLHGRRVSRGTNHTLNPRYGASTLKLIGTLSIRQLVCDIEQPDCSRWPHEVNANVSQCPARSPPDPRGGIWGQNFYDLIHYLAHTIWRRRMIMLDLFEVAMHLLVILCAFCCRRCSCITFVHVYGGVLLCTFCGHLSLTEID